MMTTVERPIIDETQKKQRSISMTQIYYFSYGSNMSTQRFAERVASANVIKIATLAEHKLKFHKHSNDGSAKCDALFTNDPNDRVIGVLFQFPRTEKAALDQIEGHGYAQKQVVVNTDDDKQFTAFTYYAIDTNPVLKPYHWYKEHVLIGANEHILPTDYIGMIENIESVEDPNQNRRHNELAIYHE